MLIPILVGANIPVYLFLGWLAFDNKETAASTFAETLVAVLKMLLIPGFVRVLFNMDTSGSWGRCPSPGSLWRVSLWSMANTGCWDTGLAYNDMRRRPLR